MVKSIYISLPVRDLAVSVAFYEALGFTRNARFSDASAAGMVWSETINVMLLTREKWGGFTTRPIPGSDSSEVMLGLALDSRAAVDAMIAAASGAGGTADINPVEDHGFMYTRDFLDPDGHALGAMWMDLAAFPG